MSVTTATVKNPNPHFWTIKDTSYWYLKFEPLGLDDLCELRELVKRDKLLVFWTEDMRCSLGLNRPCVAFCTAIALLILPIAKNGILFNKKQSAGT